MIQCLVEFVSLLQKSDKFLSFRIEEDIGQKKSQKIIPPNLIQIQKSITCTLYINQTENRCKKDRIIITNTSQILLID